jgi:rhodanese-related sulfurtransferase
LANLQGRVAGENIICGNVKEFPGTIQTGICKVFDYGVGSTGLSEQNAQRNNITNYETTYNASLDKPGFMQGRLLVTKLLADKTSRKILGAQVLGPGDVGKQIAIWAMAIQNNMTVDQMCNADLPYAPPFSLAIDHSIASAHVMQNKLDGLMDGINAFELKELLKKEEKMLLLDVRNPDEFEAMRLGIGEVLIPLGQLRARLNELPKDKDTLIVTWCKISLRGYEAALILKSYGYTNVKVLEGGLMAWPFGRER